MQHKFIPLSIAKAYTESEMEALAQDNYQLHASRRTVRHFSDKKIPIDVLRKCILTAGTAPSGANQQPWHFALITDPQLKHKIRVAAEEEEKAFYEGRAGDVWLDTLAPLGTDAEKPFLEAAPALIAIFEQKFHKNESGDRIKHYYAKESTGIATGMLISALHRLGLATLTHTPSPMNFLTELLERPDGERAFLLLVVGYPAEDALVPDIKRKELGDISSEH